VLTRSEFLRRGLAAGAALGLAPSLAACGAKKLQPAGSVEVSPFAHLVEQAREEGRLTTIGLPSHWAGYGRLMRAFRRRYGLRIRSEFPEASSAEELATLKALSGQVGAPDALDVRPIFAAQGTGDGLFLPYEGSEWKTIPTELKDANGYWVGDYWSAVAFGTNLRHVARPPETWADLKRKEYHGKIALGSDPRELGSGFAAVLGAALANGGSFDDILPGIEFFGDLKARGNLVITDVSAVTIASGETPVTIDWDYLGLQRRGLLPKPVRWELSVPVDGLVGDFFCQAISAKARHPAAAKLWHEFLLSDDGQLIRFASGQHPARFQDLVARGRVPRRLLARFPRATDYSGVRFPQPDQTKTALRVLTDQWAAKVVQVQSA
jgi:putative spermidine/putrescine transport system substrate-binding protein